jgi:hypothetical protein
LPLAKILTRDLQMFRVKQTRAGNESFEAWREWDHDDVVLATAIPAWAAENIPWPAPAPAMIGGRLRA